MTQTIGHAHLGHHPRVRSIAVGASVVAVGVAAVTATGLSLEARLWWTAAGSIAVGLGCYMIVAQQHRAVGQPALSQLGAATVALYTLSFGALGLAWLAPQSGSRTVIDPALIPGSIAFAMLGLVALTVGYVIGPPRGIMQSVRRATVRLLSRGSTRLRIPSMAVLLYGLGTAARAYRLSTGQYGYLQDASQSLSSPTGTAQLLSVLEVFATIGLVAAAIDHFILTRSLRTRLVLVVLVIAESAIGFASASKQQVLFTLLAVVLVKSFSGRPIRWSSVILGFVVVSLLFPFTTDYRNTIRSEGTGQVSPTSALAEVPSVLSRTTSAATPRTVAVDGPSAVSRRLRQVDNIAIIRQKTPADIAYRPWTELLTGPLTAAVPRALWPSKPVISTGRDFSIDYYEIPSSVYTANAVTVPGDLYRHGGMVPLLIGMALLGVGIRLFDKALTPMSDPRHLIVYVPMFLYLIKLESDVTIYLLGGLQLLATVCLSSWLTFAPANRRHSPAGRSSLPRPHVTRRVRGGPFDGTRRQSG